MSHISGEAVAALKALTEVKACDDAMIALVFEGSKKSVIVKNIEGNPLTLGQLRELTAAFNFWL